MPQHWEKLRTTVADLEKELGEIGTLDDESRELLEEAAREIQNALHKKDQALLPVPPLTKRLTTVASSFETSHPNLAGIIQKMIDALGQLGI